jgi:outer membrane protein TolC
LARPLSHLIHSHPEISVVLPRVPILVVALLPLGGCQTYQPQPLKLDAHREAFLARTADAPEVASFVASLAEGYEGAGPFDLLDGVTLDEAEAVAMVFNTDLRLARLRAGITRAGADNAGLWEDPSIGVDLTRIIQSVEHPWKLAASVGFTIPVSGRLKIEKARADLEHAAELTRIAEREWTTRTAVRRAWLAWSALEIRVESTREFLGRVDQVLSIVDVMERAGEMARTEARLFRVERAARAADLQRLESQLAQATLEIKQLMGLSPAASITLVRARLPQGDEAGALLPLEEGSPAMAVARAEYEVAERTLELEIRRQYPDLALAPGYGREDGNDEVLLGVVLPLPVFNANRRGIAEALAARDAARGAVETQLERLVSDLAKADRELQDASLYRASLESELVPLVDAQYADAREVARLGEVNTIVLLETLSRQHEARLRLIDALESESLATTRRREILGPEPSTAPQGGPT